MSRVALVSMCILAWYFKIQLNISWSINNKLQLWEIAELIDHNALTSIVSFNLPFVPPRELSTIGFLDLCLWLIHKVLVLSLTEREEQCLQSFQREWSLNTGRGGLQNETRTTSRCCTSVILVEGKTAKLVNGSTILTLV